METNDEFRPDVSSSSGGDEEEVNRSPFTPNVCPSEASDGFRRLIDWASTLPAVLFNTGFAVLAIVTLCGIVFITKPNKVMHDIPPDMWLPLLIVMAPAQVYAQFLSWSTVRDGQIPTGSAIASRQMRIPAFLKTVVALVWFCNFCIGFGIVVSLSKPHGGNVGPSIGEVVLILILTSWLAFAANVYLCLAIRTCTADPSALDRVWRLRVWLGLAMGVSGALYYGL